MHNTIEVVVSVAACAWRGGTARRTDPKSHPSLTTHGFALRVEKLQKDPSNPPPFPTLNLPLPKLLAVQLCVPAAVAGVQAALEKLQRGVSPRPLDYRCLHCAFLFPALVCARITEGGRPKLGHVVADRFRYSVVVPSIVGLPVQGMIGPVSPSLRLFFCFVQHPEESTPATARLACPCLLPFLLWCLVLVFPWCFLVVRQPTRDTTPQPLRCDRPAGAEHETGQPRD